jgi:hypothetical protein
VRSSFCAICRIIPILGMSFGLSGQDDTIRQRPVMTSIPFIGCDSDGQVGPIDAPAGITMSMLAMPSDAQKLSYYKAANGIGGLGPRGWYCFGTYGSGGETLYIKPQPIKAATIFSDGPGDAGGPGIEVAYRFGGTSGRFSVAEVIARVFPAYKSFTLDVMKEFDQPNDLFTFGPFPSDRLIYKRDALVEYRTPAESEGLGTYSWLKKGAIPIEGAAILVGDEHDLALLSIRLPINLSGLTTLIIGQFELDASRCPCN